MQKLARYRREDGKTCLDAKVQSVAQLFDYRDPAPFRMRDLDEDFVEYVMLSAGELHRKTPLKICVFVEEPVPESTRSEVIEAIKAHFEYEVELLTKKMRRTFRESQLFFLIGFVVLFLCVFLSQASARASSTFVSEILREGLLIGGWVAMWRPLESLLYDWWPIMTKRKLYQRLSDTEVSLRPL